MQTGGQIAQPDWAFLVTNEWRSMNGKSYAGVYASRRGHEWRNGGKGTFSPPVSHEWPRRSMLIVDGLFFDDLGVLNGLEGSADGACFR